jgi:hypothetical protein
MKTLQMSEELKTQYSVEDFPVDSLIHFNDGESWKVIKVATKWGNISAKPYNDLAKNRNISLAIDFSLEYLNENVNKIDKI